MSYAEKFLKAKGQDCIINRPEPFLTKVSIKRSTKAIRDLGAREGYWEGLMLANANLQSGEILIIGNNKYLVQSVNFDPASGECAFFAAKCNAVLQHLRLYDTDINEYNEVIKEWLPVNPDTPFIDAYGEIITYRMRQEDLGLLDSTKYTFQVPKHLGIKFLDRLIYNDNHYQVVSIDEIGLSGVVRVQAAVDTRP